MEEIKSFITELVGKKLLVKTHWGLGTKDASLIAGEYKGVLIGFDGSFLKLEYEIRNFASGSSNIVKETILINSICVLTVEEYKEDGGSKVKA